MWPGETPSDPARRILNMILRDGFIYVLDDGILSCVDVATGKRKWKGGRYGHGQLLLVDDLLLIQAEDPGDLVLVEATPERHHELARSPAGRQTWNNPAISGRHLLVRNHEEAVCYELAGEVESPSVGTTRGENKLD